MSWNAHSEWVADTVSFDETRCQGTPVRQHSMKVSFSAMLSPKAREKPVWDSQAKR